MNKLLSLLLFLNLSLYATDIEELDKLIEEGKYQVEITCGECHGPAKGIAVMKTKRQWLSEFKISKMGLLNKPHKKNDEYTNKKYLKAMKMESVQNYLYNISHDTIVNPCGQKK